MAAARSGMLAPVMIPIVLDGLTRRFGPTTAVSDVSLDVPAGSLFFVLGPSGGGKSTLLRLVAGLLEPDAGRIRFADRDVTTLRPDQRGVGMVFQSFALWPHMTVFENVAYGLRVRRVPGPQRTARAQAALRCVGLADLAGRRPGEISGGEQQRAALARALAGEPKVLLLDEPLSNIDPPLRRRLRGEVAALCHAAGTTTLYVTHDHLEAMAMADSIAVMHEGRILQTGTPRDLYLRPRSRFVAGLLGDMNLLEATVVQRRDGRAMLETKAGRLEAACSVEPALVGRTVTCCIRPEAVSLVDAGNGGTAPLAGEVVATTFLGEVVHHEVRLDSGLVLKASRTGCQPAVPLGPVTVRIDPAQIAVFHDE